MLPVRKVLQVSLELLVLKALRDSPALPALRVRWAKRALRVRRVLQVSLELLVLKALQA